MKILIVQTGFLGDVVLSLPVLANVAKLYPLAEISVMTTPQANSIIRAQPGVTNVIEFDKRKSQRGIAGFFAMRNILRQHRFDIVLSLHKSYRTALLLRAAAIPKRYGFKEAAGSLLYSKVTPRRHLRHEVLRNLAILQNLGCDIGTLNSTLELAIPIEAHAKAEEWLAGFSGPIISIAPGSVWATKRWTVEGFTALAQDLSSEGYGLVLVGGGEDIPIALAIERQLDGRVVNLVGKSSLLESAAVISRCQVLVTNDSAPLHLASACKTPVVALFCATTPAFGFGPWQVPSETLGVDGLSCRPCGRHGKQYCPTGTHACQLKLTPAMVLAAVHRLVRPSDSAMTEQK